jgi:hypothetical protein
MANASNILLSSEILPVPAHRMMLSDFSNRVQVLPLGVDHGRAWEVHLDGASLGFSDATSIADAAADVHRRCVNNALYACSQTSGAPQWMASGHVLPTSEAMAPHLVFLQQKSFGDAISLASTQRVWGGDMAQAASEDGWALVPQGGVLSLAVCADGLSESAVLLKVWHGQRGHEVLARTMLFEFAPLEFARMHALAIVEDVPSQLDSQIVHAREIA